MISSSFCRATCLQPAPNNSPRVRRTKPGSLTQSFKTELSLGPGVILYSLFSFSPEMCRKCYSKNCSDSSNIITQVPPPETYLSIWALGDNYSPTDKQCTNSSSTFVNSPAMTFAALFCLPEVEPANLLYTNFSKETPIYSPGRRNSTYLETTAPLNRKYNPSLHEYTMLPKSLEAPWNSPGRFLQITNTHTPSLYTKDFPAISIRG